MSKRRLLAEGARVAVGQAAAMLVALVSVRVLTTLLTPLQYGELALGLTLAMLANQAVMGPISNAVLRFYAPAVEQGTVPSYTQAIRHLVGRGSLALIAIACLVVVVLQFSGHSHLAGIAALALAFSLLTGYGSVINAIHAGSRERGVVAFHQVLDVSARLAGAAALIVFVSPASLLALLGYCLGALLTLCSQYFFARRTLTDRAAPTNTAEWRSRLLHYSMPFTIFGLFTWCQIATERWALDWFATRSDVGIYAALYQVGYLPISLGATVVVQIAQPILFARAGDASDATRNSQVASTTARMAIAAVVLGVLVALSMLVVHEHLFRVFVAAEYRGASALLPWMTLAGALFAAGQILTIQLLALLQPRQMIVGKIATSLFAVALTLVGAKLAGTTGVVIANLAFSVVFLGWMAVLFKQSARR